MQNGEIDKQAIAKEYAERGAEEGFEKVWPDLLQRLKISLEAREAFKGEIFIQLIRIEENKIKALEERFENLRSDLYKVKQSELDGGSQFYYWMTLFLWFAVLLGETIAFPFIYRDVFDLSLWVGVGFCALFPGASLFAKGILYADLSDQGKRRFRHWLFGCWLLSVFIFVISFLAARSFALADQRQMGMMSLSGTQTTDFNFMTYLQLISFCSLWLLGLSTAVGLAILHSHYRKPEDRIKIIEEEMKLREEELNQEIAKQAEYIRQKREAEAGVESETLEIKNLLQTLILTKQEEKKMLAIKFPQFFSEIPHLNGKAKTVRNGIVLGLIIFLFNATTSFADTNVFFIQDVTRPSNVIEQDFRGFGNMALSLPSGHAFLLGSDGVQYAHGQIEKTYRGKEKRQRNAIIQEGRSMYQKIQTEPSHTRDYASVLAEIMPRIREESILIVQGAPYYRNHAIDWEGKVPSVSWIFNTISPFGESAIKPASIRFKAVIIFASNDFVDSKHRSAVEHFWRVLLARLNGDLVLFTSNREAIANLFSEEYEVPSLPVIDIDQIASQEREAPLKLQVVQPLGVTRR